MLQGTFEGLPTAKTRAGQSCLLVDIVSGFGLVEDELGVRMVAKPREVHGRAHQVARELVEPLGIGGVDGGAIVDAERKEEVDALLGKEPSVS